MANGYIPFYRCLHATSVIVYLKSYLQLRYALQQINMRYRYQNGDPPCMSRG